MRLNWSLFRGSYEVVLSMVQNCEIDLPRNIDIFDGLAGAGCTTTNLSLVLVSESHKQHLSNRFSRRVSIPLSAGNVQRFKC